MNKNKQKQSGFAHLAVVIILSVALVGTLGFVFWQNFMQPKASIVRQPDTEKGKTVTKPNVTQLTQSETVSFDATKTIAATFSYPADWTIEKSSSGDSGYSGTEQIKISNPSKSLFIKLNANNAKGIGGTCTPSGDVGNFLLFNSKKVENYSLNIAYIESIVKNSAGYYYNASLENPMKYSDSAMIGKSGCDGMMNGYIAYKSPAAEDGYFYAKIFDVSLTEYLTSQQLPNIKTVSSRDAIDSFLSSADYITAKAILLSIK
jgi:hypothetical protein